MIGCPTSALNDVGFHHNSMSDAGDRFNGPKTVTLPITVADDLMEKQQGAIVSVISATEEGIDG